jgi:hypothetical protein
VLEAADALQHLPPDHWPQLGALPISEDEPIYVLRASPELRVLVQVAEGGGVELTDIVRKEALELFRQRARPADAPR